MKTILISTGDYSADLHGEALVNALKQAGPARVLSLGGIKLKGVSDEFLQDMVQLDVSGFTQPFKQFFNLKRILQQIVFPRLEPAKLDSVVLIDYYGFNIHIARKAKERGIPVFYFVSPQVWASRQGRIQKLKRYVTQMLVIFPFEEELYKKHGVPARFVGHPLMDRMPPPIQLNGRGGKIKLGLMPGSRKRELINHIPLMLDCAAELRKKFPGLETTMFAVEFIPDDYYRQFIGQAPVRLVRETDYRERRELTLCLTASGTATLENALLGLPMVVVYQTSWLTYWVAKNIIQVDYISMPNILAGKAVVPEMIQSAANPLAVAEAAAGLLSDEKRLESMHSELIQLRNRLGQPGAYRRAAQAIWESLQK